MPLPGLKAQSPQLQPPEDQEEAAVRAEQPLEPVEVQTVEPGRPYQDFVESKLRQYLQDNNIRSLVKPTQAEIRAAAIPVLGLAQRYRPGLKLNPALNLGPYGRQRHATAYCEERLDTASIHPV